MDDSGLSAGAGDWFCDYVYRDWRMVVFRKTYDRVSDVLVAHTAGKPRIVCRFRNGRLFCGWASKHKTARACVYRKFLRIKHVGI